MQAETLPTKLEAIYQQFPENPQLLWTWAHQRWTEAKWKSMLRSDESTFQIVFGNPGPPCPLGQSIKGPSRLWPMQISKPASVKLRVCAYGSGNLHICEGTVNAEKGTYRFLSNICCHPVDSRLRDVTSCYRKRMPSHIPHMLQKHGFVAEECTILITIKFHLDEPVQEPTGCAHLHTGTLNGTEPSLKSL